MPAPRSSTRGPRDGTHGSGGGYGAAETLSSTPTLRTRSSARQRARTYWRALLDAVTVVRFAADVIDVTPDVLTASKTEKAMGGRQEGSLRCEVPRDHIAASF